MRPRGGALGVLLLLLVGYLPERGVRGLAAGAQVRSEALYTLNPTP